MTTYLSQTKHRSRTAPKLAKELSLDEARVRLALDEFKGLFRKSRKMNSKGEPFYTLQLRFARRWIEDAAAEDDDDITPGDSLDAEYLTTLLNFVHRQTELEHTAEQHQRTHIATLIGAWIAALAAISAAVISPSMRW